MTDYYQTVTLILADGRRCTYTGRTQIDHLFPPRVVSVEVTPSKRLPDGMRWDELIEKVEEK